MSTADSAQVVQFDDNGTADHLWQVVDNGTGYARIRNRNSGKVLAVAGMSTADSANVTQFADNGSADHNWRLIPDGTVKLQATHTNKVLAIQDMSSANGAQLTQWPATGTADHVWRFADSGGGYFRIVSNLTGKVVDVSGVSTADGARVVQWDWAGGANQQWRLAWVGPGRVRGGRPAQRQAARGVRPVHRRRRGRHPVGRPEPGEPALADRARLVDERLGAVGDDLLDEDRRARDPDAGQDVVRRDAAAGGALGAGGDPAGVIRMASRSGSGAACGSSKSAARSGSANQVDSPVIQNDTSTPAATAVRGHGERLGAAFRGVRAGGCLDDQEVGTCGSA